MAEAHEAGLLPCPFCGSQDVSASWCTNVGGAVSGYFVECENCAACGPMKWPEDGAIPSWNARAALSKTGTQTNG